MTTPHKNTDNRIPKKEFPTEMHRAFQSEMISKYFLVFHQKETSSVFPQCSQISIKFFKILRFHVRTCGKPHRDIGFACGKPFGNCWKCSVFKHLFSTFPTEWVVEKSLEQNFPTHLTIQGCIVLRRRVFHRQRTFVGIIPDQKTFQCTYRAFSVPISE